MTDMTRKHTTYEYSKTSPTMVASSVPAFPSSRTWGVLAVAVVASLSVAAGTAIYFHRDYLLTPSEDWSALDKLTRIAQAIAAVESRWQIEVIRAVTGRNLDDGNQRNEQQQPQQGAVVKERNRLQKVAREVQLDVDYIFESLDGITDVKAARVKARRKALVDRLISLSARMESEVVLHPWLK
jgi:hypothetical protein